MKPLPPRSETAAQKHRPASRARVGCGAVVVGRNLPGTKDAIDGLPIPNRAVHFCGSPLAKSWAKISLPQANCGSRAEALKAKANRIKAARIIRGIWISNGGLSRHFPTPPADASHLCCTTGIRIAGGSPVFRTTQAGRVSHERLAAGPSFCTLRACPTQTAKCTRSAVASAAAFCLGDVGGVWNVFLHVRIPQAVHGGHV